MSDSALILIVWELVTATGLIACCVLIKKDRRRKLALERAGRNGPAKLVAWQDFRDDASCAVAWLVLLAVGPTLPLDLLPSVALGGIFIALTIMIYAAVLRIHDRDELYNSMDKERPQ